MNETPLTQPVMDAIGLALFEANPGISVALLPDAPTFTIVAVSNDFVQTIGQQRESIIGKGLFELFPTNPDAPQSTGAQHIRASFQAVIQQKELQELSQQRYDISDGKGGFTERYWHIRNVPVLANDGTLHSIIHTLEDVSAQVLAQQSAVHLKDIAKAYNLFMQAPVAVCVVSGVDYKVELANAHMLQVLGRTAEMIGQPLEVSLPEARAQGLLGILDAVWQTGQTIHKSSFPASIVISGVREQRYYDLVFQPYFNSPEDPTPTHIFCVAYNITQQMEAQKRLEESEHRFRTLIEQASVATAFYTGQELTIQYANDIMLGYWGKDNSAFGKPFREAVPELNGQSFFDYLDQVYTTGIPYVGKEELAYLKVNGELQPFYFNFTCKALRDKDGNIYGIHHMALDVTAQVLARRRVEESEARTRLSVSSARLGLYDLDLRDHRFEYSPRFLEIFDLDPSRQWPYKQFTDSILPEDLPIRAAAYEVAKQTGELLYEVRIQHPDGSIRWVRLNGKFIPEGGEPRSLLGTIMDITEEKKVAEVLEQRIEERTHELKQLNEQLKQFTYAASHDLQEPLRKISFFMDRLVMNIGDELSEDNKRIIERIQHTTGRMRTLINDLLAYSNTSLGVIGFEEVDLDVVVKGVLDDMEATLLEKGALVDIQALPKVMGDERQLRQLFQNLVSNALKYHKKDDAPRVEISCQIKKGEEVAGYLPQEKRSGTYYLITVKDNGIGFDPDDAGRIFQLFQRLHGRSEYEGTGVGLAIVQKVVANHNGSIWAESELGKGAIFHVLLPVD